MNMTAQKHEEHFQKSTVNKKLALEVTDEIYTMMSMMLKFKRKMIKY